MSVRTDDRVQLGHVDNRPHEVAAGQGEENRGADKCLVGALLAGECPRSCTGTAGKNADPDGNPAGHDTGGGGAAMERSRGGGER